MGEKLESWEVREIIVKLARLLDESDINDLIDDFYSLLETK